MTQEEKDLLLKDLCARIPYSLIVACTDDDGTMPNVWEVLYINNFKDAYLLNTESTATQLISIEEVKPYLFPMSSMTDEQRKEFIQCAGYEAREEENGYHYETYYYDLVGHENVMFPDCDGFDWLNKNHFDFRGLIEKGLAIDCTNLNIY
jgi:hypothetical protein